eukprot:5960333-Pyramimonas_sp.AAC.1
MCVRSPTDCYCARPRDLRTHAVVAPVMARRAAATPGTNARAPTVSPPHPDGPAGRSNAENSP